MIRIFLIIFIAFSYAASSFADVNQNNRILSLDEINNELKAKKKQLQPFDPDDVKIDLESLGLDDVSKKVEEEPVKTEETIPANEIPKKPANPVVPSESKENKALPPAVIMPEIKENKVKEKKEEPAKDSDKGTASRIKNMLNDESPEKIDAPKEGDKKEEKFIPKKPQDKFINAKKRQNLKKHQELERQKKFNEEKEKARLKELNELREKYLDNSQDAEDEDLASSYLDSSENIVPQRKNLDKFLIEEAPATPIVNTYRTKDNLHNPLIMTPKERLDILFLTISIGSISAFNEAYNYVKNPNVRNDFGDTLLTYSILLKKYPMMVSILNKGADADMPNQLGYTPINIALELGDFRALEILANNKADLNHIDAFGRNYLMHASRIGILSAVKLFIDRGVDVNAMDRDGFTALAVAYKHGQNIVATYLLKHGAKTWVERPYNPQEQSIIKELENSWK